mgnify:CR=1 FL=1
MNTQKKAVGFNKGDKYEDKITNILIDKEILPNDYKRAGASDKADIEINFKGKKIKIEVKGEKKLNPDFGQVSLSWNKTKKWSGEGMLGVSIRFDTYYNAELLEPYENHIAVHTRGWRHSNNANHSYALASSVQVQDMARDIHTARILYRPNLDPQVVFSGRFEATGHVRCDIFVKITTYLIF